MNINCTHLSEKVTRKNGCFKNSFTMKLADLYRELTKEPNSPISFVAHIVFERYGKERKKMLGGLYRLYTGNGYVPMDIRFAPFTFDVLVCSRRDAYSDGTECSEMRTIDLARY